MNRIGLINRGITAVEILRRMVSSNSAVRDKAQDEAIKFLTGVDKAEAEHRAESERVEAQRKKRATSGRKSSGAFEIEPRILRGCDHGADGIVLIRKGGLRLVWRSGSKYFGGIGRQNYAPAELEIMSPDEITSIRVTNAHMKSLNAELTKKMRLSKDLVLTYSDQIDATFGKGAAKKAAELKGTVVL